MLTFRGHSVQHTLIRAKFSPERTGFRYVYTGSTKGNLYSQLLKSFRISMLHYPFHISSHRSIGIFKIGGLICFAVYDILTGGIVRILDGHKSVVRDCCWHPDENEIITVSVSSAINCLRAVISSS